MSRSAWSPSRRLHGGRPIDGGFDAAARRSRRRLEPGAAKDHHAVNLEAAALQRVVILRPGRRALQRDRDARQVKLRGELIVPTEDDWKEAWEAYELGDAAQAGIVDHVSFVVMRRLGLTDAFTNDRHFRSAGFNTLF